MREARSSGNLITIPGAIPRRPGPGTGVRLLRPALPLNLPSLADDLPDRGRHVFDAHRPHVPLVVICSARPRVGRTLLARLVMEFLIADARPAQAFDANPNDRALSGYLPGYTATADIGATRDQMALLDRLVVDDGIGKVIDLAPELTVPFFELAAQLDVAGAARSAGVDPVVLFLAEDHVRSRELGYMLTNGLAGMPVVPVLNDAISAPEAPPADALPSIRLPALSPLLRGVVSRPGFSFSRYASDPANAQTGLAAWIRRAFLSFRALELRLRLIDVEQSFRVRLPAG